MGGLYNTHHDAFGLNSDSRSLQQEISEESGHDACGDRLMTFLIYLSNKMQVGPLTHFFFFSLLFLAVMVKIFLRVQDRVSVLPMRDY